LEGIGDGKEKVGMDCSIVPLRQKGLYMISTTDFFYPLVDDPFIQGKIGCANVLSDLYAFGVVNCDNMLMILAVSLEMNKMERDVVTKQMIAGFAEQAKNGHTMVTGGQTVLNPWPIIGGTAISICSENEFIHPENALPGDSIILTKPLGTQVAVNAYQWLNLKDQTKWNKITDVISKDETIRAYEVAMNSMSRLNRNAAILMHKYGAHGATDVTGFGILGHGANLASNQKLPLKFVIETLPIIRSMKGVDNKLNMFNLMKGYSAETSGGLFICLPSDKAKAFCEELESLDGSPAWIIGRVEKLENTENKEPKDINQCNIIDNPTIIEV